MAEENHFISVREHHEAIGALKDEQAKQREKTAGLEMSLLHQMAGMQRTLDDIKAAVSNRPQADHSALATHRAIETLPQALAEALRTARGTSNQSPVLIAFALLGAVALGAFGMQFIGG
jgi:hypothetical protein